MYTSSIGFSSVTVWYFTEDRFRGILQSTGKSILGSLFDVADIYIFVVNIDFFKEGLEGEAEANWSKHDFLLILSTIFDSNW